MASHTTDLLKWLKELFVSQSTWVTDPTNVYLYESLDLQGRAEEDFPRIEMQILSVPRQQFLAQRLQERLVTVSFQGYLRRDDSNDPTEQDLFDVADFHSQTEALVWTIHDAMIRDDVTLPKGLYEVAGWSDGFIVLEVEPFISSFGFNVTFKFSLKDISQ